MHTMDIGHIPASESQHMMDRFRPSDGFDSRAVAAGALVGAAVMLVTSFSSGDALSPFAVVRLVVLGLVTVSVPAGIATGLLSSAAETELHHGAIAAVLGMAAGLVLVGSVHAALSPAPTALEKLDSLYYAVAWGGITYIFVSPFALLLGGWVSKYTANRRWELTNDQDRTWGEKGRFDDDEDEWGNAGRFGDDER